MEQDMVENRTSEHRGAVRAWMGGSTRRWRVIACGALLTAALVLAVAGGPVRSSASSGGAEARLLGRIAASRASAGVGSLVEHGELGELAARQSARMSASGRIFHNADLPAELTATGLSWIVVGENVGVGPSVDDVADAFMASTTHRHNVLSNEYNAVGVAVRRSDGGRLYVTEVFAQLRPEALRTASAGSVARRAPPRTSCRVLVAEDGSRVPASFYGLPC